jgi:hypothetical protein
MDFYNIVLVVPQFYGLDKRFLKICELMSFQEVVYFHSPSYIPKDQKDIFYGVNFVKQFFDQKFYSEISKRLMLKYQPIAVLQHDYIHIENMYFFYWANRTLKSCKKIVVLSTAASNERTLDGFFEARYKRAMKLARGKIAFANFLFFMYSSYKLLQSSVRNILIPFIILKEKSNYGLSYFDNIDIKPKVLSFDYFMVFEDLEQKFYRDLFGNLEIVKKISSPISRGAVINEEMFAIKSVKDIVILFGLTGDRTGYDTEILDLWCELILILSVRYTDTKIVIKVHPNLSYSLCDQFETYINSKCPHVLFIGSQENAIATEELILNSWLIIGDSSSVLPWASYVGEKVVLSMDIGKTVNSRDMVSYSGIVVFSRDDDFHEIVENIKPAETNQLRQQSQLPSVRDFIA